MQKKGKMKAHSGFIESIIVIATNGSSMHTSMMTRFLSYIRKERLFSRRVSIF
jgi:hypothetical protein